VEELKEYPNFEWILKVLNSDKSWTICKDVEQWFKSCRTCQECLDPQALKVASQQTIKTTQALERMGMDLIGPLPKSKQSNKHMLVMQDYFTKLPKTIPLKDVTAKPVAGAILLVILVWGPLAELLSDQGPEFVVELNCELSRQWGPKAICNTLSSPNGKVEQFNRTLKVMIARTIGMSTCLPLVLQDKPAQVYGTHSLQSDAGQGTTKQGQSGNRVDPNG